MKRMVSIASLSAAIISIAAQNSSAQGIVAGWGGCCGYDFGQVTPPAGLSNVVKIAAGSYFNLALTSSGSIVGWGYNEAGQLNIPTDLTNVVSVAAGEFHSLALTVSGKVVAWGSNSAGQTNVPATLTNVVAISAGGAQSLALTASGTIVSWGDNSAGQRNIPASATNVIAISAGDYFNLALTASGKVVAWGSNAYGQTDVPTDLTNAVSIAAGWSLANAQSWGIAATADGRVVEWGGNDWGQRNIVADATNIISVATGWYHSLALRADGKVFAWGRDQFQETLVPGSLSNVVAIAGGNVHSIALIDVAPVTPHCTPPPNGLVSWWRGETDASDAAGTNNGVLDGSIGFAPGKVGQAFLFNNLNADVKVPASQSINVGTAGGMTLEAWINPTTVSELLPIFEWNNNSGTWGTHYHISPSGAFYANIVDDGGNWHIIGTGSGVVVPNSWQHVALTYDKASGVATLYCNGNVVGQAGLGTFTPQTSYDLYLGRRVSGPVPTEVYTFSGLIDEPGVYNRALSGAEIQSIFNAGSNGKCFTNLFAPEITAQPLDQTVSLGGTASFTVGATGTPPLSYQWQFNGTNISGAITSSLTISNVAQTNLGAYSVVVSNPAGSTNSANAMLWMYPYLRSPFGGVVAVWGQDTVLSVDAGGSGPLNFQWYRNGSAIGGATNQTLILSAIQFTNAGNYSVVVSGPAGSVTNAPAQVVVNPAGVSLGLYPGITVTGTVGYTYNIQATADLTATNNWTTVATLTLIQPVQLWVDTGVNTTLPAYPHRYYRVVPGP